MSRSEVQGQRRIAERQFIAVGGNDVALRTCRLWRIAFEQIPVSGGQHNARSELILQIARTTRMVGVRVTDDGVLDVGWIKAEFPQTTHDFVLYGVVVNCVNDDDAL